MNIEVANDETVSSAQDLLQKTLANADSLLDHARSDQPSLAQALKMTSTDASGGSDNDFIERLRWFVYPKECADWISEGRTVVPETESDDILGALRPTRSIVGTDICSENSVAPVGISPEPDTEEVETRKRKLHHPSRKSTNIGAFVRQDVVTTSNNTKKTESPVMLMFRDGEHEGEAPLEEILTGYDDGELSEGCQVFDAEADAWVSIMKYAAATLTPGSLADAQSDRSKDIPKEKDVVNQRKKPQRDSSAWGSTAAVPVDMKLAPSVGATAAAAAVGEASSSVPSAPSTKKNKRGRHVKPPPKMMRYIIQAVFQWNMLEEGDRLLLGLSGGKDSLSLLHCLLELQRKLPTNFEIEVCTVDPMTPSFDPSPLIPYVESLGLKYHYIKDDIVSRASTSGKDKKVVSSLCAYCARMKRGNLYTCARRNNCNKLVLAQHLDDCAESFLMSVMHNGFLRTMKANYQINAGDLSVIRPMVYCRESLMTDFAKASNLPVINENCPACFEEPKERARIKKLLARYVTS